MAQVAISRTFVLGEEHCPNCNAAAKLVGARTGPSDALAVSVACPKCKHRTVVGFTTTGAVRMRRRKQSLMDALDTAQSPETITKIVNLLNELTAEERRHELGL